MKFRNLTPHPIGVVDTSGTTRLMMNEDHSIRVHMRDDDTREIIDGVCIQNGATMASLNFLPTARSDTILIVSQLVAIAVRALHPGRTDVVYPATSHWNGAVRDAQGVRSVRLLIRA